MSLDEIFAAETGYVLQHIARRSKITYQFGIEVEIVQRVHLHSEFLGFFRFLRKRVRNCLGVSRVSQQLTAILNSTVEHAAVMTKLMLATTGMMWVRPGMLNVLTHSWAFSYTR